MWLSFEYLILLLKCLFSDIYHNVTQKFFLKSYFSWRIITIQYFDGFAIYQHEWAIGIHVSPHPEFPATSLPFYPSGLSQSPGFGCPASRIDFALVICFTYGSVHISMPVSQTTPPLASPTKKNQTEFTTACKSE